MNGHQEEITSLPSFTGQEAGEDISMYGPSTLCWLPYIYVVQY